MFVSVNELCQPLDRGSTTPKKPARDLDSTNYKNKSRINPISRSAHKQIEPAFLFLQPPVVSGFTANSKNLGRPFSDLSSDDDEEVKRLSRTIKKLHFEENPDRQRIESQRENIVVTPFELPDMAQMEEEFHASRRSPAPKISMFDDQVYGEKELEPQIQPAQQPTRKPLMHKKISTREDLKHEFGFATAAPLYRLNSMIFDYAVEDNKPDQEYLGDNVYIKDILRKFSSSEGNQMVQNNFENTSRFDKDYDVIDIVGKCGSLDGDCFKCLNKLDRMVYFVKQIEIDFENLETKFYPLMRGQMEVYNSNHKNEFVRFYQSWAQEDRLYMVYEPATYTLEEQNLQKRKLGEKEVRHLIQDVASGLEYLAKRNAAHLNLKPSNILNCRGTFKIMDMVLSRDRIFTDMNMYIAPQLVQYYIEGATDLAKCDVYSLGLLILQNITQCSAMNRSNIKRTLKVQFQYSPSLKKQLLRMISLNPNERPTLEELSKGVLVEEDAPKHLRRKLSL